MNKHTSFTIIMVTGFLLSAGLLYLSSPHLLTGVSAARSESRKVLPGRWKRQTEARVPQRPALAAGQSATLLPDGRWLLVGGEGKEGPLATASLAEPQSGTRTTLAKTLEVARAGHTATLLPDGRVLIFGGMDAKGKVSGVTEVYDAETQTFGIVKDATPTPRAWHTATVLSDGRLLIAGGMSADKRFSDRLEVWDPQTILTTELPASLSVSRKGHTATLLANGNVLLWGGVGEGGKELGQGEIYSTDDGTVNWTGNGAEADADVAPFVAASEPTEGADGVSTRVRLGMRFSHPLKVETVNREHFVLSGEEGTVGARVVPAEAGRLVFITPAQPLKEGSTYTLSTSGSVDTSGLKLTPHTLTFTTAGEREHRHDTHDHMRAEDGATPVGSPDSEEWIPNPATLKDGKSRQPLAKQQPVELLRAGKGVTALAGRVLTLEGEPLPNVTLQAGMSSTRTDAVGRFLLAPLNAGQQVLIINGTTASQPNKPYAMFDTRVDVNAGQTNVLPYTIWLPLVDARNATDLSAAAVGDVVAKTPRVPGLEVHVPKGHVLRYPKGDLLRKLTITPIPTDRPPFPLPAGQKEGLLFTMQTHGARLEERGGQGTGGAGMKGLRIVYPNYGGLRAGTIVDIWSHDARGGGWFVSGKGKVSRDGKQINPDKGRVRSSSVWCAVFIGWPGLAPPKGPPAGGGAEDGDPVDLSTGLFVYQKTDLIVGDTIPLSLMRTYRQNDAMERAFGVGATHPLDMFLVGIHDEQPGNYADLILPDGARIRYDYQSGLPHGAWGEHLATTTAFYQSTLYKFADYWLIQTTDGTIYDFGWKSVGQPYSAEARTYLRAVTDRFGNRVNFYRDNLFRLVKVVSPNNRWMEFSYSGTSPSITQAKDNIGRTVGYEYDTDGRLWKVTDPKGGITEYTYDAQHRMLTIKDARGIVFLTNEYDANGRVKKQTLADGTTYQFDYTLSTDPNNSQLVVQTDVTNPRGIVRRVTFNGVGYPLTDTYALGKPEQKTITYEREPNTNTLISATDPSGRKVSYSYDGDKNVTAITYLGDTPNEVKTQFTYSGNFKQLASVTDALNRITTFTYDDLGNMVSAEDPSHSTTTFTHDALGRVKSVTDPVQRTVQFGYEKSNLVNITDSQGKNNAVYPDSAGRPIFFTDRLGRKSRLKYDAHNNIIESSDTLNGKTLFEYDPNGNLRKVIDARGGETVFDYDNMNRLISRRDPLLRTESYEYDAAGNLVRFTDRRGKVFAFRYDNLNRLTFTGYGVTGSGPTESYESTITYAYDLKGRIEQVTDSLSGIITLGYDELDRLVSETTAQGVVTYNYDKLGRRTNLGVTGQLPITYAYNDATRSVTITQGTMSVVAEHDAAYRRKNLTLPNGVKVEYGYTGSRLTSLVYKRGAIVLGDLTYGYDDTGRRTRVGGSFARSTLPAAVASSTYNEHNQLVQRDGVTLTYDQNGNLTGDGTNSYTWDTRNRLAAISGTGSSASFGYDAFGRRISKTVNGQTVSYLYDGADAVQEQSGGAASANMLVGGVDEVFLREDAAGMKALLRDGLGSTVALANGAGNVEGEYTYDPFGKTTQSSATSYNPSQFTGRENDATGLHYYRARYYSPTLQRFISEDQIGFAAQDTNLYAYVGNDPLNHRDPSGHYVESGLDILSIAYDIYTIATDHPKNLKWNLLALGADVVGLALPLATGLGAATRAARMAGRIDNVVDGGRSIPLPVIQKMCFVAGTPVHTRDGTKPIEEVRAGDEVLSYNEATKRNEYKRVTQTFAREAEETVEVSIAGETSPIEATSEHPFYARRAARSDTSGEGDAEGAWIPAGELSEGDLVRRQSGAWVRVERVEQRRGRVKVYNFEVAQNHNYFVGRQGALVHNSCISMDEAIELGAKHVDGQGIMGVSGSGGYQFINTTIDLSGDQITKIARFDVNPFSPHVQKWGPHLNLETHINGVPVRSGPLVDPHIPINPSTVRSGDIP
jgi:RHS repeat-associated protein